MVSVRFIMPKVTEPPSASRKVMASSSRGSWVCARVPSLPSAVAWVAAAVFRPVANWSSVATTSVALPLGWAMAAA